MRWMGILLVLLLIPMATALGDINNDGTVSAIDAQMVLSYYEGITPLTVDQIQEADVDGDGRATASDAYILLAYSIDIVETLPVRLGDVDGDRFITPDDATLISAFVAATGSLSSEQKILADVNADGEVTSADAEIILDFVDTTVSSLPVTADATPYSGERCRRETNGAEFWDPVIGWRFEANSCIGDVYREYTCSGSPMFTEEECEYGCTLDGCEEAPEILTCVDTDNGRNYALKGTAIQEMSDAYGGDLELTDICMNSDELREHYCVGATSRSEIVDCPHGCENGACLDEPVESSLCTDSDGGRTYGEKGNTQGLYGDGQIYTVDSCFTKGDNSGSTRSEGPYINEGYCSGDFAESTIYLCPNGCFEGECLDAAVQSCRDSDGGVTIQTKGSVTTGSGKVWNDYCNDPNYVYEYSCNGKQIVGDTEYCQYGCESGACKTREEGLTTYSLSLVEVSFSESKDITHFKPEVTCKDWDGCLISYTISRNDHELRRNSYRIQYGEFAQSPELSQHLNVFPGAMYQLSWTVEGEHTTEERASLISKRTFDPYTEYAEYPNNDDFKEMRGKQILYRTHRLCATDEVLERQVVNTNYYSWNVACTNRKQEQCYDDGSFDRYYDERCEQPGQSDGPNIIIVNTEFDAIIDVPYRMKLEFTGDYYHAFVNGPHGPLEKDGDYYIIHEATLPGWRPFDITLQDAELNVLASQRIWLYINPDSTPEFPNTRQSLLFLSPKEGGTVTGDLRVSADARNWDEEIYAEFIAELPSGEVLTRIDRTEPFSVVFEEKDLEEGSIKLTVNPNGNLIDGDSRFVRYTKDPCLAGNCFEEEDATEATIRTEDSRNDEETTDAYTGEPEDKNVKQPVQQGICEGCEHEGRCLPIGTRTAKEDVMNTPTGVDVVTISTYCSTDQLLVEQVETGNACQNNYECVTNECSSGVCIDLADEVRQTRGLLEQVFTFLQSLFGL